MITRSFHTQWCGLQEPSGAHSHLPILSEDEPHIEALLRDSFVPVRALSDDKEVV